MRNSVIALGNAVIDAYAFVEDSFLTERGIRKGDVPIFEKAELEKIVSQLKIISIVCGGSTCNSLKAMGFMGHDVAFIGKYADDKYGEIVKKSLDEYKIRDMCGIQKGGTTTQIYTCITPDAQRTMMAVFGATNDLMVSDLNLSEIGKYGWLVIEGYQFGMDNLIEVVHALIDNAKKSNQNIAMVFSSIFCAVNYKKHFIELTKHAKIISGTMEEYMEIFDKKSEDELLEYVEKQHYEVASITMGGKGAYLITKDKRVLIPAPIVEKVVDTTGAGDFFFGGFLYGYLNGYDIEVAGKLGGLLAGNAISHVGTTLDLEVKERAKILLENK